MGAATVVLVHGPCGTPAVWSRLIPLLDDVGIGSVAVHLPSSLPASDLDDVAFLRSVLDDLDRPTVLVGHSGSGVTITVGEHRSVRHLVFLDAFPPDVGESLADAYRPGELDESFAACIKLIPGAAMFDADALAAHLQDTRGWSAEEAREIASGTVPSRFEAQLRSVTVASWRTVPSTFIGYADSQAGARARARWATTSRCGDDPVTWRRSSPPSRAALAPSKTWSALQERNDFLQHASCFHACDSGTPTDSRSAHTTWRIDHPPEMRR